MRRARWERVVIGAETYWSLITNLPHIGFELTWEVITGVVVAWPIKRLVARHDQRKHQVATDAAHKSP